MGRHRSDPHGIWQLAIVSGAVLLVVALFATGGYALYHVLNTRSSPARTPTPTPSPVVNTPTLELVCLAVTCEATVRIPGGDVLFQRSMYQNEVSRFTEDKLEVTLEDGSAVAVKVNGRPRPRGKPQQRETFTVTRNS